MKRFALTLTILCAFTALTYAGPEQLPASASSGKEMKSVVQPMAPACPSWAGFYIGGFGGFKFGEHDVDLDLLGDWDLIPDERDSLEDAASRDLDLDGFEAGGLIGYNCQFGNWVLGVEAAGGYLWMRDFKIRSAGIINTYDVATSLKTHYLFTVGPRIGYALCRWMPYITGGLAIGDIDFDQRFLSRSPTTGELFGQEGSESETRVGWMVGGGLEYAITNHWRVRAQYQYIDLGEADFDSTFTDAPTFFGEHEATLKEHNASVAVIFGF